MKQILQLTTCTLLLGIVIFISFKKVSVTTAPAANQALIAKAGPYQTISSPKDSVLLNGRTAIALGNSIFLLPTFTKIRIPANLLMRSTTYRFYNCIPKPTK